MSREARIRQITRTKYYIDGDRFTTKAMVSRLNGRGKGGPVVDEAAVNRDLSVMKDRGLVVDHRTNHHTGGRTTKWSRSKGSIN